MINDFHTSASYGGFIEVNFTDVDTLEVNATPADIMVGPKVFPHAVRTLVDANGWIDVRSFTELTILGWAETQNSNVLVQSKQTSIDPSNEELVATTLLTAAAAPAELYASNTNNFSHIRILHSGASATGGTTNISVFAR